MNVVCPAPAITCDVTLVVALLALVGVVSISVILPVASTVITGTRKLVPYVVAAAPVSPVKLDPSPTNPVAVTTPTAVIPLERTSIPSLAVIIPRESTLLTSSYVRVPPIVTLPLM